MDSVVRLPVGDDPPGARLLYGYDVREGLRRLAAESVHCVATSPPYWGLRDYGTDPSVWGGDPSCEHEWVEEATVRKGSTNGRPDLGSTLASVGSEKTLAPGRSNDHGDRLGQYREDEHATCLRCGAWRGQLGHEPDPDLYVEHVVEVFREVHRVLRQEGTVWLNLGDTYCSAGGTRTYGSFDGAVGRGPSPRMRASGPGLKVKDLVGIPWRVALALQADGWWLRNALIWRKENPLPSPVQDRFSCTYENVFLLAKSSRYYFDLDAIRVPYTFGSYDGDGNFTPGQRWLSEDAADRKMSLTEGQLGTHAGPPRKFGRGQFNPSGKNPGDHWVTDEDPLASVPAEHRVALLEARVRELEATLQAFRSPEDVWDAPTQPFPGSHFAVWPQSIPERCIRAGTSEHGCCARCGAPWERVVEREDAQGNSSPSGGKKAAASQEVREAGGIGRLDGGRRAAEQSTFHNNPRKRVTPERVLRGWSATCECGKDAGLARCVVLDPFSGSGTTGRVALRLGRDYVGVDLNESYFPMAAARVRDEPPPDGPTPPEVGSVLDIFQGSQDG